MLNGTTIAESKEYYQNTSFANILVSHQFNRPVHGTDSIKRFMATRNSCYYSPYHSIHVGLTPYAARKKRKIKPKRGANEEERVITYQHASELKIIRRFRSDFFFLHHFEHYSIFFFVKISAALEQQRSKVIASICKCIPYTVRFRVFGLNLHLEQIA